MITMEIEKAGIPVAMITAMTKMAQQIRSNRIVTGTKIPHPCGNPELSSEGDLAVRLEIVKTALQALQTEVEGPTVFNPNVAGVSG